MTIFCRWAKEIARQEGSTPGQVVTRLARRGLEELRADAHGSLNLRSGVPVLSSRGEIVTLEKVDRLMMDIDDQP